MTTNYVIPAKKKSCKMKQITLIVPDTIDHVIGSSRGRKLKSEEVTMDNMKKALCDRSNYHQYYYFETSDKVQVVSIVDYNE
jgi:hypothetical protein